MLPITRVIIYKHGMAYYQREGLVTDNSVLELSFKAEQMNDVLKSLTTLDYGGGSFGAISYDSEESAERRLAELSLQVPKGAAITQFLDQLKGVHVSINTPTDNFTGAIIGIEVLNHSASHSASNSSSEQSHHNEQRNGSAHLALLHPQSGMNYISLQNIVSIQFTDKNIQRELASLMEIHAGIARNEKKRLSVQTLGKGERKICLSYVVEAPVWKTSYRIIILDEDKNQHLLQGWSIVDNTCDEDWQEVHLSLVSGLPVSFRHNLYSPRHLSRPEIRVNQEAATAPPVLESGISAQHSAFDESSELDLLESSEPLLASLAPAPAAAPLKKTRAKQFAKAVNSSNPVQTRSEEKGDLFSYEINQAVNIKRGQSALVPILQTHINSESIVYYNEKIRRDNPMSSFLLKNNTELTLEGGPITVYQGESYLGEAMLDTLRKQDEKIIPYSIDLSITVTKKISTRDKDYTKASHSGHYIYKYRKRETITEYLFDKKSEKTTILYLDHPFQYEPSFDASNKPKELTEITENFWRYRIALPEKCQTYYQVVEVEFVSEAISIPGISAVEITSMLSDKLINQSTAKQLQQVADLCEQRGKLETELGVNHQRYTEINDGQDRLRNNIHALGNSTEESKLRARYIAKLNQEEDALEHTRAQISSLEQAIEQLSEKIEAAITAINVDTY